MNNLLALAQSSFAETDLATAQPTKHFAFPPFAACHIGGNSAWWYVANKDGFNCLSFAGKPGAKFTTEQRALKIAAAWNDDESVHYRR